MADPISAGNPVSLDPFQDIVNVGWPRRPFLIVICVLDLIDPEIDPPIFFQIGDALDSGVFLKNPLIPEVSLTIDEQFVYGSLAATSYDEAGGALQGGYYWVSFVDLAPIISAFREHYTETESTPRIGIRVGLQDNLEPEVPASRTGKIRTVLYKAAARESYEESYDAVEQVPRPTVAEVVLDSLFISGESENILSVLQTDIIVTKVMSNLVDWDYNFGTPQLVAP